MMTTSGARTSLRIDRACLALVVLAALGLAIFHYMEFRDNPRPLWQGLVHDRSGHYQFAQELALAARELDLAAFFSTLEKAKVWPPVHGLAAAAVLVVGGIDYRLAVLPSLAGWIVTAVFGFLLARRCTRTRGNAAGVIASAMILASPALRLYGLDIMLESLGAALTLMALYFYAVARDQPLSATAWRRLALTLTILFFEKYNYWLLLVFALGANEIVRAPLGKWIRAGADIRWRSVLRAELHQPLTWLCAILSLGALALFFFQPEPVALGGRMVSLYPPNNLVTLAYAAFFFRLVSVARCAHISEPVWRPLLVWHGLPIAISFLLPRRLSVFVWFLGPFNRGEQAAVPLTEAVTAYFRWIATDYHIASWSALLAAFLFFLALLTFRRMPAGGRAVILLVLISAALTFLHPNQKSRFLHTWLPALWVAGAAGLVNCLGVAGRWGQPLPATAATAVVLLHAPAMLWPGRAAESASRGETRSLLDITDTYLPAIDPQSRVAFFCTVPCWPFLASTYHERYPHSDKNEFPLKSYPLAPDEIRRRLAEWETKSRADTVVLIDIAPDSPDYLPIAADYAGHRRIAQYIGSNPRFSLKRAWSVPEHGCTISLWTRN